jgi:hypothetical protein
MGKALDPQYHHSPLPKERKAWDPESSGKSMWDLEGPTYRRKMVKGNLREVVINTIFHFSSFACTEIIPC